MPAGFESFNDFGGYLIDGRNPNLHFHSKGSATNSVTITCDGWPIFFVRPTNGYGVRLQHNGGNSYTFFCAGSFLYWAFAPVTNASKHNFGLQVFSEAGVLIYTSGDKPLRIHSVETYTRAGSETLWEEPIGSVALPPGGPLATKSLGGSNFAYCLNINGRNEFLNFGESEWNVKSVMDQYIEAFVATASGFQIVAHRTGQSVGYTYFASPNYEDWGWWPRATSPIAAINTDLY